MKIDRLPCFPPVFESGAASGRVQGAVGALEAPLSSEAWFGDWLTFDLLLHLPPLLSGQQKVHMLSGDVSTVGLFLDTEIHGSLSEEQRRITSVQKII